jgi:hypothetical protein
VLGYVFKPVSFWYAHRADGSLAAVLAEVNNTFGERHAYLLAGPDLAWGREQHARKVFHVSPFCRVEGPTASASSATPAMRSTAPHPGAGGPGRRPGPAAADQRGRPARGPEPGQRAPGLLRHPADDPGRDRPHPLAGAALWRKRVPFFGKPAAPEHFVTR